MFDSALLVNSTDELRLRELDEGERGFLIAEDLATLK